MLPQNDKESVFSEKHGNLPFFSGGTMWHKSVTRPKTMTKTTPAYLFICEKLNEKWTNGQNE